MKRYKVTLTRKEREELERIRSKGRHQSQKVLNALILLNTDEGPFRTAALTQETVAQVLQSSARKIDRVKRRFVEEGLTAALMGHKRERVYQKKADGEVEAHLVALSCGQPPVGFARWSLRLLADTVVELGYAESLSHETVRRVLKKTNSSLGGSKGGSSRPTKVGRS